MAACGNRIGGWFLFRDSPGPTRLTHAVMQAILADPSVVGIQLGLLTPDDDVALILAYPRLRPSNTRVDRTERAEGAHDPALRQRPRRALPRRRVAAH